MPTIAAKPMSAATDAGLPVTKMVLVSAVALIDRDGRVLLAQRLEGKAMAGLWEFPGGKIESGETPEAALIRELHEELGIDTAASCLAPLSFASHSYAATKTHPAFHRGLLGRPWAPLGQFPGNSGRPFGCILRSFLVFFRSFFGFCFLSDF